MLYFAGWDGFTRWRVVMGFCWFCCIYFLFAYFFFFGQDAVFVVLDAVADIDPQMLSAAVMAVKDTHRGTHYTDKLLTKAGAKN